MGTPFDPSQLSPSLWPDFNAGFSTFNVADFEGPDIFHPQYLSAGGVPAGWAGATKFTLFGFVLIDPTLRTNVYTFAALESATDGGHGFAAYRDSSNHLTVRFGSQTAAGSQLVMGNNEQPGTANSGQGRIAWGLVFDGGAGRLDLYVQGAKDPSVTRAGTLPASLAAPAGSPAFTLGYGLFTGEAATRVQLYNVGALAGYAASDAEMLALANLAAGSKYPKHWSWGALPPGAPAAASFTNFWALGESSTGASPVSRADSAGTATLTDGLGAGGNVASATTASVTDKSGNDHYGTSPTIQTLSGSACTTPQAVAADANGHNVVHFATATNKNCYLRFGQFGLTDNPVAYSRAFVGNWDFADATHEMVGSGSEVNSPTAATQASDNIWGDTDNDDFGATQGHPAQLAMVAGDGTNLDAWCSPNGTITPGTYQVFVEVHQAGVSTLYLNGAAVALTEIGSLAFWRPGGAGGTNYQPLSPTSVGRMGEWSYGGCGNIDQGSEGAAWMGKLADGPLFLSALSADDVVRLSVYEALKFVPAAVPAVPAPAGLAATPAQGQVSLSWGAVVGATSYNVLRSVPPGVIRVIANVGGTSYVDSAVTYGVTYTYYVQALIETTAGTTQGGQTSGVSGAPLISQQIDIVSDTYKPVVTVTGSAGGK